MSYDQYSLSPALCEDILADGSHVFGPILLIYNRNVYLSPPRLYTKIVVDKVKIQEVLSHSYLQKAFSSAVFLGRLACTALLRFTHQFSVMFKSRNCEVHCKTFSLCLLR